MSSNVKFGGNFDSLIEFAKLFLKNCRLPSLDYDVERCLKKENGSYSPIPALMYCFSTIDLLGALVSRQAIAGNTTRNSKEYAILYMNYPTSEVDLIWDKFYRHKIVHLSIPQTTIKIKTGEIISWNLHDENPKNHRQIIRKKETIDIGNNCGQIHIDGKFVINIKILKDDIINSVNKIPEGYLDKLTNDTTLQKNFEIAINQIYEILLIMKLKSIFLKHIKRK